MPHTDRALAETDFVTNVSFDRIGLETVIARFSWEMSEAVAVKAIRILSWVREDVCASCVPLVADKRIGTTYNTVHTVPMFGLDSRQRTNIYTLSPHHTS